VQQEDHFGTSQQEDHYGIEGIQFSALEVNN